MPIFGATVSKSDLAIAMHVARSYRLNLIAWGMIPLAAWAGLPSTACLCADGGIKLVCSHPGCSEHAGHEYEAGSGSHCCGADAALEADPSVEHADCCGAAEHDSDEHRDGVHAKAGCTPILMAPSVAPKGASTACDSAPAIVVAAPDLAAPAAVCLPRDVAELDTGPPLDRVIVFRSLLI